MTQNKNDNISKQKTVSKEQKSTNVCVKMQEVKVKSHTSVCWTVYTVKEHCTIFGLYVNVLFGWQLVQQAPQTIQLPH